MTNDDFRGDTFFRSYEVYIDDEIYTYNDSDKINLVFHNVQYNKNFLPKTIENIGGKTSADVTWTKEEMSQLEIGSYVLETEVVTDQFTKTYQENLYITEDFIVGEQNG